MIKFVLFLMLGSVAVFSQTSPDDDSCTGQTTINYIYGTENFPQHAGRPSETILRRASPGKSGPPGQKGEQGIKGEPGSTAEILSELRSVKQKLATLEKHIENVLLPPSCDDINETNSGSYMISPHPTRVPPFLVSCNFATDKETVIGHDTEEEIEMTGCEPNYCYKRKIKYSATTEQIAALINVSSQCRQFIKLRCNSVLLNHRSGGRAAQWISRDGTPVRYWGGATSRRAGYCACGETRSCRNPALKCNCDSNMGPETSDEGYLTDKNKLPVIELQLGDAGDHSERGWHTLGPLICSRNT